MALGGSPSPILARGKLYITREDGKTYVITPEKDSKVVAENELPSEFVLATPVFVNGKVLLRTNDHRTALGGNWDRVVKTLAREFS